MYRYPRLPFYESFGAIPSSYLISLSYEEQILWLCHQVQSIKEGTPNYNYELLENKPSINHIPLIGNITSEQLGLSLDYNAITNKPFINGVVVAGNKSLTDYGIQAKLIAGDGILIENNVISAVSGGGGGGTSNYNGLTNKPQINDVTLQGNLYSKDLDLQDRLKTNMTTSQVTNQYFDIRNIQEGDVIPPYQYNDLLSIEVQATNQIIHVLKGEKYDIKGEYDFIKLNEDNVVNIVYTTNGVSDEGYLIALSEGDVLLSFHNTNIYEYSITKVETGEGITSESLNEKKIIKHNKDNIQNFLTENFSYETLELTQDKVYYANASQELEQATYQGGACYLINLGEKPINNVIKVKGSCIGNLLADNEMFIYADSDNKVITWEDENLAFDEVEEYTLSIPDNAQYLAINFTDITTIVPQIQVMYIDDISEGISNDQFYETIDQDIILYYDGTTNYSFLDKHYYYLKPERRVIYYKDVEGTSTLDVASDMKQSVLYYKQSETSKTLIRTAVNTLADELSTQYLYWSTSNDGWRLFSKEGLTDSNVMSTIPDSGLDDYIPSIYAVRNYVNSHGGANVFYTEIDQNLVLNYDGSVNVTLESEKYYRLMPTRSLAFYKDVSGTPTLDSANDMKNAILYYYETASSKSLTITGINAHNEEYIYQELFWLNSSDGWHYRTFKEDNIIQNGVTTTTQRTIGSIPTTGNNNDVPTINAIRTYVASEKLHNYSTAEHVIGTWTDGKPLYEKCIVATAPNVSSAGTYASRSTAHNISNPDFIYVEQAINLTSAEHFTLMYMTGSGNSIKCVVDDTYVKINSDATNFNDNNILCVLRYTKTTD